MISRVSLAHSEAHPPHKASLLMPEHLPGSCTLQHHWKLTLESFGVCRWETACSTDTQAAERAASWPLSPGLDKLSCRPLQVGDCT